MHFDRAGIISSKGIKANIPLDVHSKSRYTADVIALPEVHVLHLLILLTSPFPEIIPDFSYQSFKVPEFNSLFHSILQEFTLKTHLTFTSAVLKEVAPAWTARLLSSNVDFFFVMQESELSFIFPRVPVSILAQRNDLIPEMEPFHFLIFKNINKNKASWQQSSSFHNKLRGRRWTLWKHWLVTLLWHARHI